MFKKIFVPGGNGFLGRRVVAKLRQLPGVEVVSLSLRDGYDFRNVEQTSDLFAAQKFDAVLNCAAYVGGVYFGAERAGEIFYNNTIMSASLLDAARRADVRRYVNPIANCAYPGHLTRAFKEEEWWNGPLHESVAAYGYARKSSWVQAKAYRTQYGLDAINLIVPNMYGPGDHFDEERSHALGALVMKFVEAKRKDLPSVVVLGTGKPVREWLYVDDGAEAMIRALDIPPTVDPINVGVGRGVSIMELALMIKETVGYNGDIVLDPTKADGAPHKTMDNARLKKIFGWAPPTTLEDGIKQTVRWYAENSVPKPEPPHSTKLERITDGKLTLAIVVRGTDWAPGLSFISADEDYQQVGFWYYEQGKELARHAHIDNPRQVLRTQEVIFMKQGRMRADVYTEKNVLIRSIELRTGDMMVMLRGGHGYHILEDSTQVLEIKNGPFTGTDNDRKRF
jgi:GDP-L-fucose synthase